MPTDILAVLNQISQIGLEATAGTPVPATRRLQSIGFEIAPSREIQGFRPRGSKFMTKHAPTREWSEGSIADGSGFAYNEVQYILASIFSRAVPVEIGTVEWAANTAFERGDFIAGEGDGAARVYMARNGGETGAVAPAFSAAPGSLTVDADITWVESGENLGGAHMWRFDVNTYAKDDIQPYTIETGDRDSGRAYRSANAFFNSFSLESARGGEVGIGGDIMANARIQNPLTGGSLLEEDLIPAVPPHLDVLMDDSLEALGTTFLDGNFSMNAELSDRANQVWFHGRRYEGPAGRVETEPSSTFELVQADGEEVDDMLLALEEGQRKFFSFDFMGPEIEGAGVRNRFLWDAAAGIGDAESYDDEDGVYAATVPFAAEHDGGWGRSQRITLVNGMAALD